MVLPERPALGYSIWGELGEGLEIEDSRKWDKYDVLCILFSIILALATVCNLDVFLWKVGVRSIGS
ncbi:hypothetical protein K469DRAFT_209280 [Zopfia rhizophila CBS 207.26]|uniref:Preprotein translocase subunit SecE n=1 Tax=Zopfia rhizophila CBS 207.26 TaxID=1314779 RepID=A0A6A6E0V1_9PEZI|nr:hypothetical protein K469DRAFT_209280 [Zopfia rhizophila CBS 207.26]